MQEEDMDISENEDNTHEEITREESPGRETKTLQDQSKRIILNTRSLEVRALEYIQGDNYYIKHKYPTCQRLSPHQLKRLVKDENWVKSMNEELDQIEKNKIKKKRKIHKNMIWILVNMRKIFKKRI